MFDAFYPITPVNYCLNDFVFELVAQTNYCVTGDLAENYSTAKLHCTVSGTFSVYTSEAAFFSHFMM